MPDLPDLHAVRRSSRKRAVMSEFFRARIDDRPQFGAVLEMLHLRRQAAVARDPFLDPRRIDRHQFGGTGNAGDANAGGPALVEIRLVETEARARRDADPL